MAFGKAVTAEPLDLVEAAPRELFLIPPRHHAIDQLALEIFHAAIAAERGHGPAQAVGFGRREIGRGNGQLHRLFLEQRHAQRLAEHVFQLIGIMRRLRAGKVHRFAALPAAQIGVHHVALDRAGPHDGDLDDQIIELRRLQARQHVHLRPAFDLEDADRIPPLQHAIHIRRLARHIVQRVAVPQLRLDELERPSDAAQHPQRQHIHLHQAQRVDIVLVPLDEGAVRHGGVVDRHELIQPRLRQHETADMLRKMARHAHDLVHQFAQPHDFGAVGIKAAFSKTRALHLRRKTAPHRAGQPRGQILAHPQHLAHFAHRTARAIMDHGGGDASAFAAIAFVNPLHHLLAALMLEIDIDIGWFLALFGNEAGKQQIVLRRIDRRDAQHEAHRAVGGAAAALAQDAPALRERHNVVDGEEIGRIAGLGDDAEFVSQQRHQPGRHPIWPTLTRLLQGQRFQPALGAVTGRHRFVGIFIPQLIETEIDPGQQAGRRLQRLGVLTEQAGHVRSAFQVAFGIGGQPRAGGGQRFAHADAADHVVQRALLRRRIERGVECQQRHAGRIGHRTECGQPPAIAAAMMQHRALPQPIRASPRQFGEATMLGTCWRQRNQQQAIGMFDQVGEVEDAVPLFRPPVAGGEQARQSPPTVAVRRIGDHIGRTIGEHQPRAHGELERRQFGAGLLRGFSQFAHRHLSAHHTGDGVLVRDADAAMAQRQRRLHHRRRARRAFQEGEMRGRAEFGETAGCRHHANRPCRYQRGGPGSRSYRPWRNSQNRRPSAASTRQ